ncbi:NmrA family NAD(P)-binding protein [Chitinophaga japonensis]|uniref:Uncharacterized protein YbjT (DUF2867 family) n=1 Tax=Chitinophaga japonensis TaxID=104662 RepID=A0A562T4Q2_CHIJA|nr:NAD(P)H-binding protein [Chitinophaga japonensis]TWI88258.1 uncharacterized protein YbjT (DUF2867 family) [Chitinophaga japonensis]
MQTTKTSTGKTILVLGATGKTGSRIFKQLSDLGYPLRSGSRSANPRFEWLDDSTWAPALQGVHSVYISFQPDLAVPGAVDIVRSFTRAAADNGVQKLVLLSGRGEPEAQDAEQVVMRAGLDWTILRASWFNQNFSEGYLIAPLMAGHVALPAGEVGEPFIDADDIADVAVAALTNDQHNGQLYELTGPRLLTFREAVATISEITGRPVQYEQIPVDAFAAAMTEQEVPQEYVQLLTYLFSEVLDGRNEKPGDGVQRALGRAPIDFRDYARKAAAAGLWRE